MSIDCILVLGNDSPLIFAMEMLLTPSTGINAVKSEARDVKGLVDEIFISNSQVVILDDAVLVGEEFGPLSHLLLSKPELKIIVVLRESNFIQILRKDEIMIQSSSDFLEAIRSV